MTDTTTQLDESTGPFDDYFATPYTDIDEWRESPVRHRYVHGGFDGTDTRFSFYFPPAEQYEGRFFQHFTPRPLTENLAQEATGQADKIGFSAASGAYFVETNGGGDAAADPTSGLDLTIGAYWANVAAAKYSRIVAEKVYGTHRPYGYAFGGSGGAFRTIGAAENTTGVWDGFVPYVVGSPMAIPNVFTVRMHAQRILHDVFDEIVDAADVGSPTSPFDGLTDAQRSALSEATRLGFPITGWFAWRTMGTHAFSALYPGIMMADPSYFDHDFWNVDGYLGADRSDPIHLVRSQIDTVVTGRLSTGEAVGQGLIADKSGFTGVGGVEPVYEAIDDSDIAALLVEAQFDTDIAGAEFHVLSGAAAGARIRLSGTAGHAAIIDLDNDADTIAKIAPGDQVRIDNSNFLAAQTYHRHQVPDATYPVWDQFRDPDGSPLYPQRPFVIGPVFAANASGTVQSGRISDKMIVVSSLLDREAFAWQSDWYRQRVVEHLGAATDSTFRLWFTENALHGDDEFQEFPTRTVSYLGVLQQALRAVAAWVEDGVEPASSTSYDVVDAQVKVAERASDRAGIQAVVTVTGGSSKAITASVGERVGITGQVDAPAGGGDIIAIEWNDGRSDRYDLESVDGERSVTSTREVAFDEPGTYFVTVRATTQAADLAGTPFGKVFNLDRVRVTVS